jgi:hypothetical protein
VSIQFNADNPAMFENDQLAIDVGEAHTGIKAVS